MRRFWVGLALLALAACSAGGSTDSPPADSGGDEPVRIQCISNENICSCQAFFGERPTTPSDPGSCSYNACCYMDGYDCHCFSPEGMAFLELATCQDVLAEDPSYREVASCPTPEQLAWHYGED